MTEDLNTFERERGDSPIIPLELLAPAGSLQIGLDALAAGADAIYVGAPRFGARAAAGVSISDISRLTETAHLYGAKVYVALNTILYDSELQEAESMSHALYEAGADALIIQDLGLLGLNLPPIALHASTQCHNNDIDSLLRLEALGFEQAVLARELTAQESAQLIKPLKTLRAETFIHGALCVCYSGRCYLSHAFAGRSANRGDCAQLCRLPYSLEDAQGTYIRDNDCLLSLKDLNRALILPQLIEAGISSFKIEGRLKSASYVRNVTAYYRILLDRFICEHPTQYRRSSLGVHHFGFTPDPFKSFSRGATTYQLRKGPMSEKLIRTESPKSEGEPMRRVKAVKGSQIILEKPYELHNGDGICFYTSDSRQAGGRVNKVLSETAFLYLGDIKPTIGTLLYRNFDIAFEEQISRDDAVIRRIPISIRLEAQSSELTLTLITAEAPFITASGTLSRLLEVAKKEQPIERLVAATEKLGDTPFLSQNCTVETNGLFIPISVIGDLRRSAVAALEEAIRLHFHPQASSRKSLTEQTCELTNNLWIPTEVSYLYNVSNDTARNVYKTLGAETVSQAFELSPEPSTALMTTKHCIRRFLGYCTLERKDFPYKEPLFLVHGKMRIRLSFDCSRCQMQLFQL